MFVSLCDGLLIRKQKKSKVTLNSEYNKVLIDWIREIYNISLYFVSIASSDSSVLVLDFLLLE